MIILAADSSSLSAAAAVCDDEKIISEGIINNGLTHSQTLLPLINGTVKSAGTEYENIDLFAVTTGPGSFTGVRIGTATIKGIAFAQNAPCVSVSSLAAAARTAAAGVSGIICAVMDARRNQFYNAIFCAEGGKIKRLCEDRALSCEELLAELARDYGDGEIYVCGDGTELLCSLNNGGVKLKPVAFALRYPRGFAVAAEAAEIFAAGGAITSARLNPVYLRPSQAERELKKKRDEQ